ncbi:MAG: protein-methionine-sulfoxide reductase catalytic subunit MsrP [Acidobacteria bacterium]|nr:protein-methionine-sulfoxide reductase catalytic subunit MsrP [Acidobacteriota bacterium]
MLIKKAPDIAASAITPKPWYLHRREFLQSTGLVAAAAVAGVLDTDDAAATPVGEPLTITKKLVTTTDALTPRQAITTYCNFYEYGADKSDPARNAAAFKPRPWSVSVEGHCAKPGVYTLEDVLKPHALEERVYRLRCVEGWSMVIPWVGFPLGDLLARFQPNGNATFVEFTTVERPREMAGQRQRFPTLLPWPYKEGLRMDEAMHPLTIIAVGLYGETLLNQNGAPLRLVVPWKYGFKSIKSIVRIRFVDKQPLNTWQEQVPNWYGFYANVNPAVDQVEWSQATERRIGEFLRRKTLMFNGYGDQVASMYAGMNLRRNY